jgi:branched-chain amino acid transport system permease protein
MFLQLLINGLVLASIYILVASGFSLVLGVTRILNFAHAEFYMLGAFTFFAMSGLLKLNWILGLIVSAIAMAALGGICYWFIFKPLYGSFIRTLAASMGIGLISVQGTIVAFGEKDRIMFPIFSGSINIAGATVSAEKLTLCAFALLIMLGLGLILKTKVGKAMYAVAEDQEAAALQGINVKRIFLVAMSLGCAMAGVAGSLVAPMFSVNSHMGGAVFIMAILTTILSGHGSMKGAIIIGSIIGLIESFGYYFMGSSNLVLIFFIALVIIYFKPFGLFGRAHQIITER